MAFTKKQREEVHRKLNGKCGYCGEAIELKQMQIDHIIPQRNWSFHILNSCNVPAFLSHLAISDVNHIDNLMPACRVCNNWKSTHTIDVFRDEIAAQISRLNNYSSNFRMAKKYQLIQETHAPVVFYFERLAAYHFNQTEK